MMHMDKEVTVVTHNGSFHTDDVFAVAALFLALPGVSLKVVRTRDPETIASADHVVDVGGVYDPAVRRFDHHQGTAGSRDDGVPYSSFGLVWKQYGESVCGSSRIAHAIDRKLVVSIDAADNGVETYAAIGDHLRPYTIHNVVDIFRPTWKEAHDPLSYDRGFMEAVALAKKIIEREIVFERDTQECEDKVEEAYRESDDKRIVVLDGAYPWEEILADKKEPLFVVSPDASGTNWKVKAVRNDPRSSFANRKDLPESWAGKRDAELSAVTGVPDAVFCHMKRFIAVAGSKEGAVRMARLAVESIK